VDAARLVVTLARIGSGVRQTGPPAFDAATDWSAIVKLAVRHRVAPLVWQALSTAPAGAVPAPIMAEFETQMWRSTAARMLCEHSLGDLLGTLASHGIEVLVLKGAALAHQLYPRPELRPYHDLDILCRPRDYPRLDGVLLAAGYRGEKPVKGTRTYASSRTRSYFTPSGDVEIEVHLDVLGLGIAERHYGEFWRTARTVEADQLRLRTLAPLYQLLHLAVHVQVHCYSRLLWLIDMDLLIRQQGDTLDWARLMALARDEGVGTVLRHALASAHAILGTPLPVLPPPTIEERCLGVCYRRLWPLKKVRRLERREYRRLLRFNPGTGDPRDIVYGLLLLGRRREKWRRLSRDMGRRLRPGPQVGDGDSQAAG
jgi:Uncharacterised nucleotidyltransferase